MTTKQILIRVTDKDHLLIKAAAAEMRVPIATYARMVLVERSRSTVPESKPAKPAPTRKTTQAEIQQLQQQAEADEEREQKAKRDNARADMLRRVAAHNAATRVPKGDDGFPDVNAILARGNAEPDEDIEDQLEDGVD